MHSNSYTIYVNFSGPLGASIRRREIKIDFTINELLLYPTKRKIFFNLYEEYSDIPRNVEILVYSIEEILIEKIICIIDRSRNEPRDIYDLWFLLSNEFVKLDMLKDSFIKKAEYKNVKHANIVQMLEKKKVNYERLWVNRLYHQVLDLPHFDQVYRDIKRKLRESNYI
ncbi:MAG: nucleotidyl transferase AbiEii/AbiGii toxin family protein [Candidatus Aminicenantes bacterium]|nr:nucleotidyl transferase AbiEii/AbiGii toxin family protein [Candidatus Aminicenantes bacterium]